MYSTTAYLYQQKQTVLVLDSSGAYFDRRWQSVYAKNLKIYRGVENVILFEFINQDQKPVNITGLTITFVLYDDRDGIHLAKDLEVLNATFGRAKVTIREDESVHFNFDKANYGLEKYNGESYQPVFVDDYAGAKGNIDVLDGTYPPPYEPQEMNVPDFQIQQADSNNRPTTGIVYVGKRSDVTSFQFDFDNFTGNIKAQGAETQLGPWYDIATTVAEFDTFVNQTQRRLINVVGYHNYIRFEIDQYGIGATGSAEISNGAVTSVSVDSGGSEYYSGGNVNVDIEGIGVGATATGTVTSDTVSSLTLTNEGQGYNSVPNVKINLGSITGILYK